MIDYDCGIEPVTPVGCEQAANKAGIVVHARTEWSDLINFNRFLLSTHRLNDYRPAGDTGGHDAEEEG